MRLRFSTVAVSLALGTLVAGAHAGCAAVSRPPATPASIAASGEAAGAAHEATIARLIDGLARRAVVRGDRSLDLLLLSGGGQHGAYGIGFLRGWRARTDAPMPRFDLVTGISTGALQAPFALLGTEAALDAAATLYRNAAAGSAPTVDWLFWLRRTGGVVDTTRYRRAIAADILNERMRDELWVEFEAGRLLATATTDLDLGIGRLWDLGHELRAGPGGPGRVQSVLLATTAIPAIFPPGVIDGHVHADGGRRERAPRARLRRRPAAGGPAARAGRDGARDGAALGGDESVDAPAADRGRSRQPEPDRRPGQPAPLLDAAAPDRGAAGRPGARGERGRPGAPHAGPLHRHPVGAGRRAGGGRAGR
jgi:predicted acylesterase/phospholipase RssA